MVDGLKIGHVMSIPLSSLSSLIYLFGKGHIKHESEVEDHLGQGRDENSHTKKLQRSGRRAATWRGRSDDSPMTQQKGEAVYHVSPSF